MTADLDAALAAEEHRQGAPYTAEPEHCEGCAEVDRAWVQAVCEHEDWVDITELAQRLITRLCNRCGHVWETERQLPRGPSGISSDKAGVR